jgi:hypothetical protein
MSDAGKGTDAPQARRIREAVAEATKRRDRYADERMNELLSALDYAADNVAEQNSRFDEKVALRQ